MQVLWDDANLRGLIQQIVASTLTQFLEREQQLGEKLAFTEPEAAGLLSLRPHQLRDARLRGEIVGCRVGKRILYERQELLSFLDRQRQL